MSVVYVSLSMLGVAAIALMLSTFTDSPLGAALGALAFLIASTLLLTLDAARGAAAVPADPLLAVVRRPVPRPDPVARHRAGRAAAGRLRRWCSSARLGELHHQGHHLLSQLVEVPGPPGARARAVLAAIRALRRRT